MTEEIFKQPVIVYNYPKDIKAFYMKLNEDGKTVAAMDVLVPKVRCRGCGIGGGCEQVGSRISERRCRSQGSGFSLPVLNAVAPAYVECSNPTKCSSACFAISSLSGHDRDMLITSRDKPSLPPTQLYRHLTPHNNLTF